MQKNFNLAWRNPSNNQFVKNDSAPGINKAALIKKIIDTTNALRQMSVVISLSSVVIEDKILLNNFAENLETLSNSNIKSTIIHDYKNLVESHLDFLGARKNRYSELGNYGISDLYEMIICGHINKRVVSKLCSFGLQALSFSGKDGSLIVAGGEARSVANAKDLSIGEPAIINPEILFELEETRDCSINCVKVIFYPFRKSLSGKKISS